MHVIHLDFLLCHSVFPSFLRFCLMGTILKKSSLNLKVTLPVFMFQSFWATRHEGS